MPISVPPPASLYLPVDGTLRDASYPNNFQSINQYGQSAANNEGLKPTFRYANAAYTPGISTAGTIFYMAASLSAGYVIKISRLAVSGRATANSQVDVVLGLAYQAALPTTTTNLNFNTVRAVDYPDGTSNAVAYGVNPNSVISWSAAQTIGTTQINMPAIGSNGSNLSPAVWEFGAVRGTKSPTLRNSLAQSNQYAFFTVGLAQAVPSGSVFQIEVEWTEESLTLGATY